MDLIGTIVVKKRTSDYIAYFANKPNVWESGKSIAEAIGKLIQTVFKDQISYQ